MEEIRDIPISRSATCSSSVERGLHLTAVAVYRVQSGVPNRKLGMSLYPPTPAEPASALSRLFAVPSGYLNLKILAQCTSKVHQGGELYVFGMVLYSGNRGFFGVQPPS